MDDDAQMMLLTAVILILGFIALSGLAARLDQIPDEAALARDDVFFDEVDLVLDGMTTAMDGLNASALGPDSADFVTDLGATLSHLVLIEAGRGHSLVVQDIGCVDDGGAQAFVQFRLASPAAGIDMNFTRTYPGIACA